MPVKNDDRAVYYEKLSDNKLQVNDDVVDFSNTSIIEYEIPEELRFAIKKAYRETENGELYLYLTRFYSTKEKTIWEEPEYYGEGTSYRGTQFETYTKNGELK